MTLSYKESRLRDIVESHLATLRRFAWAYTGSRTAGDGAVTTFLRHCIDHREVLDAKVPHKNQLFHHLYNELEAGSAAQSDRKHETLGREVRGAFLLSALEDFSACEIAYILGEPEHRAIFLLRQAETMLARNKAMDVLIIEDEALIAFELKAIVEKIGHHVVGRAATHQQAVMLAKELQPDLVLADVQLAAKSSGIEAVSDLRKLSPIEPVFVTAFPQRVSSSMDASPLFIIAKPFAPDLIETTLRQAAMQHQLNQSIGIAAV